MTEKEFDEIKEGDIVNHSMTAENITVLTKFDKWLVGEGIYLEIYSKTECVKNYQIVKPKLNFLECYGKNVWAWNSESDEICPAFGLLVGCVPKDNKPFILSIKDEIKRFKNISDIHPCVNPA